MSRESIEHKLFAWAADIEAILIKLATSMSPTAIHYINTDDRQTLSDLAESMVAEAHDQEGPDETTVERATAPPVDSDPGWETNIQGPVEGRILGPKREQNPPAALHLTMYESESLKHVINYIEEKEKKDFEENIDQNDVRYACNHIYIDICCIADALNRARQ